MIEGVIARLTPVLAVVHAGRRPQASALPAVTVSSVSGAPVYSDDGEMGLSASGVQVDCWGTTYASAKTTAATVKTRLSAFVGAAGGVTFQNVLLSSEQDVIETGSNQSEYLYRTILDFNVWTEE